VKEPFFVVGKWQRVFDWYCECNCWVGCRFVKWVRI